jgi:hypothetical protein
VAAALFAAAPAHAAPASASGSAIIIRPGTLVNSAPLSFGNIVPSATAGTVTVSETGIRSSTGGVTLVGGTVSAAAFTGMTDAFPFWVDVDAPTPASITLTRIGGGPTMTVNNFVVEGNTGFRFVWLNSVFNFRVGGRLNVAANQAPGTYNGTFSVTVNYF